MGILQRLKRVTLGRIETFLSRVEDPEVVFPQLIEEMQQQLALATETEAQSAAAVKRAEGDVEEARDKAESMGKGAALALKQGDEDTARRAVKAQIEAEQALQRHEQTLQRANETFADARAAREQIQAELKEMKSKKDEIISRARVAKARKNIQETVAGGTSGTESILDAVARMEEQVEEDEAELEIQATLHAGNGFETSLDRKLKDLGREAEIENRLAALKAEVENKSE
ncbi:MAG: PspA/IM30 family protein [Phycisphaerae bacterium]